MNLWLDDVRPAPDGWVWAKTSRDAIAVLTQGRVEVMSFDHDLGGEDTGYVVATWLEEAAATGAVGRVAWRIHSANPVGRRRLQAALQSADRFWDGRR